MRAGAVECDVHLSKDGRLVVIHDGSGGSDDERAGGGRGENVGGTSVVGMPGRGLEKSLWGNGCGGWRICWGWAKCRRTRFKKPLQLIIEIKAKPRSPARIADRVVAVLRSAGMVRRAIVNSF